METRRGASPPVRLPPQVVPSADTETQQQQEQQQVQVQADGRRKRPPPPPSEELSPLLREYERERVSPRTSRCLS